MKTNVFYSVSDGTYSNVNFTDNELEKVTKTVLEYIIALAVEWHIDNKRKKDSTFIFSGQTTELSANKLLFYPFYFTTANGHSKALFEAAGTFKMIQFGPISIDLFNSKVDNAKFVFDYFVFDFSKFEFLDTTNTIAKIKRNIENKSFNIQDGIIFFKDIYVQKDANERQFTPIADAIKSSITALQSYTYNRFLESDLEDLKKWAMNYYHSNRNKGENLLYDDVVKDRVFNPVF